MAINHSGFAAVPQIMVGPVSFTFPTSLNALSTIAVTVPGATPGMHILCDVTSGLGAAQVVVSATCTAANTVAVTMIDGAASVNPAVPVVGYFIGL